MLYLHEACTTRSSHLIRAIILLFSALNLFDEKTWLVAYGEYKSNTRCMLVQDIEGSQYTAAHEFPCNRKFILSVTVICAQERAYQSGIYKSSWRLTHSKR